MQETIDPPAVAVEDPQSHKPCDAVEHETGGDLDLASNPDYADVFASLSEGLVGQAMSEIPYDISKYPPGKLGEIKLKIDSADTIRGKLGCAGCILSDVCLVSSALNEITEKSKATEEHEEKLEIARQGVEFIDSLSSLMSSAYKVDALKKVNDETRTDSLPLLLWGVDAKIKTPISASDIPEISGLNATNQATECSSYEIETEKHKFTVIDASDAIEVNGVNLPDASRSRVLLNKFFERMLSLDKEGNPRLAKQEPGPQTLIENATNKGITFEIRMGKKNRMYFTIAKDRSNASENDGEETKEKYRIIILGAHGDNIAHQDDIINAI